MAKLAIFLAIIGFAYWYWSGPYQKSTQTLEADRLQDNALIMQRCINQEKRMQGAGGLAGSAKSVPPEWTPRNCAPRRTTFISGTATGTASGTS